MGLIKCEIVLNKASKIFWASELVGGTVNVSTKAATNISTMELCLVGQGKFGTEGEFEVYKEKKVVQLNKILPSGTERFPISWPLPSDLAPTTRWKTGFVQYSFISKIGVKTSDGRSEEYSSVAVPVEIVNLIDLTTLPQQMTTACEYNAAYFDPNMGDIFLRFVLNRKCFIPGEWLKFNCAVTFDPSSQCRNSRTLHRRLLRGLSVVLEEVVYYYKNREEKCAKSKIWVKTGPAVSIRGGSGHYTCSVWEESAKIPNCCKSTPLQFYSSGFIRVHYFLNVSASLRFVSGIQLPVEEKPQFRIPIVIGAIPLERPLLSEMLMALLVAKRITTLATPPENAGAWVIFGSPQELGQDDEDDEECPVSLPPTYYDTPPPPYDQAVLMPHEPQEVEEPPPQYTSTSLSVVPA